MESSNSFLDLKFRDEFHSAASENLEAFWTHFAEDGNAVWSVAQKSSQIIDHCLSKTNDSRKVNLLTLMRSTLSDVLYALYCTELGFVRCVTVNLRAIQESYASVYQFAHDEEAYKAYMSNTYKSTDAISFYESHKNQNDKRLFGKLYGLLTNEVHFSVKAHLGRLVTQTENGKKRWTHLKEISLQDPIFIAASMMACAHTARELGCLAEEVCLDENITNYFWQKTDSGYLEDKNTKIDILIQRMLSKFRKILNQIGIDVT